MLLSMESSTRLNFDVTSEYVERIKKTAFLSPFWILWYNNELTGVFIFKLNLILMLIIWKKYTKLIPQFDIIVIDHLKYAAVLNPFLLFFFSIWM